MTQTHYSYLLSKKPEDCGAKVDLLLNYVDYPHAEVDDPYYSGIDSFGRMYDTLEESLDLLLEKLKVKKFYLSARKYLPLPCCKNYHAA